MKKYTIYALALALGVMWACKKSKDLPGPETPVISFTTVEPNIYVFTNATPSGGYISIWDFAGLKTSRKYQDTVFFGVAGTYTVTLTSNSKGGYATTSMDVVVPETSPYGAKINITKIDEYHYQVIDSTYTLVAGTTQWDFDNGLTSTKMVDTVYFPFAGSYKIKLTSVSSKGQSTVINTAIDVAQNDPNFDLCSDPVITNLTGGCTADNGKTWVIDPGPYKTNVGDKNNLNSSYYHYPDGLSGATWTEGALKNSFTFILKNYQFNPANNYATLHFDAANKFFGMHQAQYADIQYQDPKEAPAHWILNKNAGTPGTGYAFTLTNGSYMGYFENRYTYYIVSITSDTMYVAHTYNDDVTQDAATDGNARYFTFVVKK